MFTRKPRKSLQFVSMSQGERERERKRIERFSGVEYEAIRRRKFPRGGAQTALEERALIREKQEKRLARLRGQNHDIVDISGWAVFWAVKGMILLAMPIAVGAMILMEGMSDKVLLFSGFVALMGVGFLFKDGFNPKQWRRREYSGLNRIWRWTGTGLVHGSVACMIVWSLFETVRSAGGG